MKKQKEQLPENPKFHDTWLLLRKYRDVVWGLELSVQQVTAFHLFYPFNRI